MSETILEAVQLKKRFGEKEVLKGISFSIPEGGSLGLLGESGCGKSTTASVITGMLRPDDGEVTLCGQKAVSRKKTDRKLIGAMIQMVFQDPKASFDPRMKLLDSLTEPLFGAEKSKEEMRLLAEEMMGYVNLPPVYLEKYPWEISGGECQRAALARSIIGRPKILICDEATSALDVSVQEQVIKLIRDLQEEMNLSVLFISHDVPLVLSFCDAVAVMKDGVIIEKQRSEELLANPREEYTKLLLEYS